MLTENVGNHPIVRGYACGVGLTHGVPVHAAAKAADVVWTYQVGGAIWASLTAHDGRLYVASDDHHLDVVELATHKAK